MNGLKEVRNDPEQEKGGEIIRAKWPQEKSERAFIHPTMSIADNRRSPRCRPRAYVEGGRRTTCYDGGGGVDWWGMRSGGLREEAPGNPVKPLLGKSEGRKKGR